MNISWNIAFAKERERFMSKVYRCPAGKLTIGYGRNIEDVGVTEREAEILLQNDLEDAVSDVRKMFPGLDDADPVRFSVLVDMRFNLGLPRLNRFRLMLKAVAEKNWQQAAAEMVDSLWYHQVGIRAQKLVEMMSTGEYVDP